MKRHFALLLLPLVALLATPAFAQIAPPGVATTNTPPNPNGAIAALHAIPAHFQSGIVKLSADNANVNPRKWHISARDIDGGLRNFTVSRGRVSDESSGIAQNLRAAITGSTSINLKKVKVDTMKLWHAAQNYASGHGENPGTCSYALSQKGRGADPIWTVWVYTHHGHYLGTFQMLATTGAVISTN